MGLPYGPLAPGDDIALDAPGSVKDRGVRPLADVVSGCVSVAPFCVLPLLTFPAFLAFFANHFNFLVAGVLLTATASCYRLFLALTLLISDFVDL